MSWDKIWAINKKLRDPTATRYTAISADKICHMEVDNMDPDV